MCVSGGRSGQDLQGADVAAGLANSKRTSTTYILRLRAFSTAKNRQGNFAAYDWLFRRPVPVHRYTVAGTSSKDMPTTIKTSTGTAHLRPREIARFHHLAAPGPWLCWIGLPLSLPLAVLHFLLSSDVTWRGTNSHKFLTAITTQALVGACRIHNLYRLACSDECSRRM